MWYSVERNNNKIIKKKIADASAVGYYTANWQLWRWWHIDRGSIGTLPAPLLWWAWGERFLLWGFIGGGSRCGWWRLHASRMRMDKDIWLSAVRMPIWLCQKSTRESEDTRGLVSKGKCILPPLHSSSSSSFTGWNLRYFCLCSCFICQNVFISDLTEMNLYLVIDCSFAKRCLLFLLALECL